jgi:hypothetical protein
MLLSGEVFEQHLEEKYQRIFKDIPLDQDMVDLFHKLEQYLDINPYVKLLTILDLKEMNDFMRFFYICLRRADISSVDENENDLYDFDLDVLKDSMLLQILFVVTMQYYFL